MLDWLKRKPAAAPGEQPLADEGRKPATDERLERMLGRLGGENRAHGEPPAEESDNLPPSRGDIAPGEPAPAAPSEIDPLPVIGSRAAEAPAAALRHIDSPDSGDSRPYDSFSLRREELTITQRGSGPSAAELLAKGYSFATGPDGRMVVFDAEGRLTDAALPRPDADSGAPGAPAAVTPNEIAPPARSAPAAGSLAEMLSLNPPPSAGDMAAGEPAPEVPNEIAPPASDDDVAAGEPAAEALNGVAPPASGDDAATGEPTAEASGIAPPTSGANMTAGEPVAEASNEIVPPPTTRGRRAKAPTVEAPIEIVLPASGDDMAAGETAAEALEEITPLPKPRKKTVREPAAEDVDEIAPPPRAGRKTAGAPVQMRVIAVASQKGGSGKTTIAAHLAVRADAAGHGPVVLIDTDPQGSLAEWWRARAEDTPHLASVMPEALAANLAELRSYGTALAVIDTPPALTGSIEQVIAMADLILIPVRPSPHDLRAAGGTVELARKAGKPFLFVVNSASPRASITAQAVAALSEHGRVAPVILYQRTEFAASMIDGRTVMETAGSGRSAQEIAELWECVHAQIGLRVAA
jgi:chromosome partitioning protein